MYCNVDRYVVLSTYILMVCVVILESIVIFIYKLLFCFSFLTCCFLCWLHLNNGTVDKAFLWFSKVLYGVVLCRVL